jgi:uncharacterized phage protein (TIGR01671 family)
MQVIKFRGWDTVKKVMYSPEEMGRDELTINPDGRGFVNVHGGSAKLSEYYHHIIPLQYTGRKDKTGKEIYNGDLLKSGGDSKIMICNFNKEVYSPYWELTEVVFKDGCFMEIIIEQHNSYFGELPSPPRKIFRSEEYKEVVGSKYTNPELLTIKGE